jgi:hypothetical protein
VWKEIPWARVIMRRLSKALQHVYPKASFPKFGNFPIDMPPNCPTMKIGSNDCGFYIMRYIKYYDHMAGAITSYTQPVSDYTIAIFPVALVVHVSYMCVLLMLWFSCRTILETNTIVKPGSRGQSRVHRICVPGSISTHMLTSQV